MNTVFKVNEYITLKLENEKTNIYINHEFFRQCKKLILNIDINKANVYKDIRSIDDISSIVDAEAIHIPHELEFWGHCSNLQVWSENNYNTDLLHSNLSFPLLKKLTEVGDLIAMKVFKEEILRKLSPKNATVSLYLLENHYFDYFTEEELIIIYNDFISKFYPTKLLLPFLKALSFHKIPIAHNHYNKLVRDSIIRKDFYGKRQILDDHAGILSEHDLLHLFKTLSQQTVSKEQESVKFTILDSIVYILHSQYDVSFEVSDLINNLLYKDEQIIYDILSSSQYPYIRLDFEADEVRRRVWEEKLYYDLFEGHVRSLELLCNDLVKVKFYDSLERIKNFRKLNQLNLLFFSEYKIKDIKELLNTNKVKKIKIFEFNTNSQIPNVRFLRK